MDEPAKVTPPEDARPPVPAPSESLELITQRLQLREGYSPEALNEEAIIMNAVQLLRMGDTDKEMNSAKRAVLAGAAALFEELANACRKQMQTEPSRSTAVRKKPATRKRKTR